MFFRDGRQRGTTRRNAVSNGPTAPTAPDTMFPHLPRHRADFLREQTVRLLNEEGFATSWRPDGVIEARSVTGVLPVSLDTLSLQLADAGSHANLSELLELIRRHIHAVTTGGPTDRPGVADLSDADFLRHLRVRLAPAATLDAMTGLVADASRSFLGDLHVCLVLDTPDRVIALDDDALAAHGSATAEELSDLYRVGYRNTWQELADCRVRVTPVQHLPARSRFWTVESDSFFLTSAALFLDELLPRWIPGLDTVHGVIVAVPHRHLILVREVTAGQDLLDGIKAMSTEALAENAGKPGALSARLHLRHEGVTTVFTDVATNGEGQQVVSIQPDAYLTARLED
ncbi:hypothetical protein PQI66_10105 [Corynebacterium sp. USCH3]|uniref:hypothetical protein n=1 Tax=Corynebacterium sp. USCH3 TaxID=3024840 RepID=UPI0030B6821D